jgi:hypothetical protein
MKRLLYTTLFAGLILVLAVAAVFALRGPLATQTVSASAPVVDASAASALAPNATDSYNFIALPLDSSDSFTYTASGLMSYVGSSAKAVVKWDAAQQKFITFTGGLGDFSLETGGAYFVLVDSTSSDVLSLVGDVPPQGSITFSLVAGTSTECKYNAISLPLDQDQITTASELMTDIGGVSAVVKWDATQQKFVTFTGGLGDFAVSIGYPYFVCLDDTAPSTWP